MDIVFGYVDPPAVTVWKRSRELGDLAGRYTNFATQVMPFYYSNESDPVFEHVWNDTRASLRLIQQMLAAQDIRLRVVYIPYAVEVDPDLWQDFQKNATRDLGRPLNMDPSAGEARFAALMEELGIEFISLLPLCREKGAQEMFADHFSRMGHHWAATYLAQRLLDTTQKKPDALATATP